MHGTMLRNALAVVVVSLFAVTGAYAVGGVYMDDFQVTNNGVVVFGDNFQDGNHAGWLHMVDAKMVNLSQNPRQPAYSLHLNQHHTNVSRAYRRLDIKNAGMLELSTGVLVTPNTEQYNCVHKNHDCALRITLQSGNTSSQISSIVYTNVNYAGCRMSVTQSTQGHGGMNSGIVLPFNRWALVAMRLDPNQRVATVFLDGKPVKRVRYDPAKFTSIREIGILTSFGDGSARTD